MDNCTLPLEAIGSRAALAVYSVERRELVSEHRARGDALEALASFVEVNPDSDAAIFERGEVWTCILRCPLWHERWLEEARKRFAVR